MKVLVFAPHNDDEILGVGGTIAKYAQQGHEVYVCEVTAWLENMAMTQELQHQAIQSHDLLGVKETLFLNLPVVHLKETATHIKNKAFCEVTEKIKPNIAYIPHVGDMHIDHAETTMAAMVALRPLSNPQLKAIYAYETLSETEWNIPNVANVFMPNVYSDIHDTYDVKLKAMECFTSQLHEFPHPRSLKAIEALARLRGSTIGAEFAESFMQIRAII